jgi:DNA-binding SARP family transcriptional activator
MRTLRVRQQPCSRLEGPVDDKSNLLASDETVVLQLIGGFQVTRGGTPVALPRGAQRLLVFLVVGDRELQRSFVASSLWLDSDETRARANLRTALWTIGATGSRIVAARRDHLRLTDNVIVDLHQATTIANALLRDPDGVSLTECRCPGLHGDILTDWSDEWLATPRERFLDLRLHALEAVCVRLTMLRRFGEAVQAGRAAVCAEPLRQTAHHVLMLAYAAEGNREAAMREFRTYARVLQRELGIAPSEEMRAFAARLRSGAELAEGSCLASG